MVIFVYTEALVTGGEPTKQYRSAKSLIQILLLITSLASGTLASGNERQSFPPPPPAGITINRPASFFAVNKGAMLGIIAVIASLSLIICLLIINIIQRRRATLALRESEAKYLDLYENAPDMYYSVDVKTGIIQKCNGTFLRATGYAREEVIGRPVFEFYDDASREEAIKLFQGFSTAGVVRSVERRVLRKDGSSMIVTLNVSAIRDGGGNIIASRSIWRDITARKREAEEQVRVWNLVESSLNEIYIFDAKTLRFDYANFGALKNIGYTLEELQQRTPLDLKPEITEYAFRSICESLANHEAERQVFRTVHRRKDGSLYPAEVHLQYIEQGEKPAFVAFILDITERKRSEDALLAAEKSFRNFLENIEQLAVMIDRNGNITFCNNYLLRLTGWSRYEVMQNNWFDLFQPGDVGMKIRSVFSSGISEETVPLHYENPIITRSGEQRLVVWNNALLRDSQGAVTGMASIGIDVTEHRKLEEQLLQSQKMEAIGTLAGGVAHDFNNILTTILGCASLIRMQAEEANQQSQLAAEIIASVERATELTKSLLAFGRKQAVRMEPINFNDTIYNFQKILSRLIGENIEFRVRLAGRGLIVEADKGQLEQILMNVTANARDAMPEGGKLSIKTEEVVIGAEAILEETMLPGRYAVLTIADNGIGMEKNIRERIFEPFFTTKEVGKGTGLGLSMVYGIVKKHNGFIEVSSEPGKGTMFRVYLPLIDTAIQDEVTEDEEILPRGNATILLVEDEEKVRSMTSMLLKNAGYRVLEAGDGEDALSVFRDHQDAVQLIITDVVMPKKNGKEMYEEINRIKADVPVIFMSGYAANIMGDGFFQREGIQYLQKPLKPAVLLHTIHEIAKSSGVADEE